MKTPGPWKVSGCWGLEGKRITYVNEGSNFQVATTDGRKKEENGANAEFIVRACNSHDDLLEACKEFVRKVECGEARSKRSYQQMKAAISKAERKED